VQIELSHIMSVLSMVGSLATIAVNAYVTLRIVESKVSALEARIKEQEARHDDLVKEIGTKMDRLVRDVGDVKVGMARIEGQRERNE